MNRVDVLILTALQSELDAVLREHEGFEETRDASGTPVFFAAMKSAKGQTIHVAAAWLGGMGETTAALQATSLAREFDPTCLAMCGICAGKRGSVALGDVIVAERVYSYDHGKLFARGGKEESAFEHDIETYNLDKAWHNEASRFAKDLSWAKELLSTRPITRSAQERWVLHALFAHEAEGAPSPMTNPERKARCPDWSKVIAALRARGLVTFEGKSLRLTEAGRDHVHEEQILYPDAESLPVDPAFQVHLGAIATGKVVQEDQHIFERLSRLVRKTIGLEMEAAAIGQVAAKLSRRFLVVKGISDFADNEKNDVYREFAASASAAFLLAFVRKHFEPDAQKPKTVPAPKLLPELPTNIQATTELIERAYQRRAELQKAGVETALVDQEILGLKRRLREGGHLHAGDSLGDGRYLLIEEVGRGGYGYVWRARDRRDGVDVAIKILHSATAADPSKRERFFRGARIMAELKHEAVVRVLEQHGEDGGFSYFVMEFVPGGDLRQAVLRGDLKVETALRAILEVSRALALAHARKIVHRDVKPANILIDADGKPKMTDFDLVAAHDTTGGTKSGALGTFVYAAPECLHHPQAATPRADVFGLGMTAVFSIYGRELPMDVVRDASGFIERLSCSPQIKAVLQQAVAWDAAFRFANAMAFCEALREALQASTSIDVEAEGPHTARVLGVPLPSGKPNSTSFIKPRGSESADFVNTICLDRNGLFLAVGHRDGTTRVWDLATSQCMNALWSSSAPILALAFAPHAPWLAVLSTHGHIAIWDTSTGEIQNRFSFRDTTASSICFSPSGATLAVGCSDGMVRVVSLGAEQPAESTALLWAAPKADLIFYVGFTPDRQSIVSCSVTGEITKTSSSFGRQTRVALETPALCAAQSPGGDFLAVACVGEIFVVSLVDPQIPQRRIVVPGADEIRGIAFGYSFVNARHLMAAFGQPGAPSKVVQASFRAEALSDPIDLPTRAAVTTVASSDNGLLFAIGTESGTVLLVDPRTRSTLGQLHPSK